MHEDATWGFHVSLSSDHHKETLLNDIQRAREIYKGDELAKELARIKLHIDDTEILTSDIIINLLLSYCDIQVCNISLTEVNTCRVLPWHEKFLIWSTFILGAQLGSCCIDKIICGYVLGHLYLFVVEILEKVFSYQMATPTKSHIWYCSLKEMQNLTGFFVCFCVF